MRQLGVSPHPWQRLVGDVSLELVPRKRRADGASQLRLGAGSVGVIAGRQCGKTTFVAGRVALQCMLPNMAGVAKRLGLHRIVPQRVAFTAQDRNAAVARWKDHVEMLRSGELASTILRVSLERGAEAVLFRNGSRYEVVTPSRTGARGRSLDLVVIDEALAHPSWLVAAMRPTMAQRDSAVGCIGAQFVLVSNAGDEQSTLLADQRELGRRAVVEGDRSRCWLEWSAPENCDPYDEAVWRRTLPTLGRRNGIELEFIRAEAESMTSADFAREYLCITTPRDVSTPIAADRWAALPDLEVPWSASVVFGVDATWERTSAAVVAACALGDAVVLEVVEVRDGVDWLADRVVELAGDHGDAVVVVDRAGPASSIIPALERAAVDVLAVTTGQVTEAAAVLADLVAAERIGHGRDARLDAAVVSAARRKVGERWAFRRSALVDSSPLVAASLAVWHVATVDTAQAMVW